MKRNKRLAAIMSGLAGGLALAATPAWAGWTDINVPQNGDITAIAGMAYDLNMFVLWICVVLGIVVFGAMGYSMYYHRKSMGHEAVQFSHSTVLEILWTIIPIIIVIVMAAVATKGLFLVYDTEDAEMDIKVTGYQWLWKYDYLGEGVTVYSKLAPEANRVRALGLDTETVEHYPLNVDHPLVLPTDTKIRFHITSGDVIHAWWVIPFGWKWDAMPGIVNQGWTEIYEPGVYRGQCVELCGRDHGFMPVVVVAKTPEEYQKWLAAEKKRQGVTGAGEQAAAKKSPPAHATKAQARQPEPTRAAADAAGTELAVAG
ncbi:MAG: cytochrome c oxidase subunit II [Nitrococcus sp.]|nr:cytochrome c oxidase subunit II [Nitrococcus sp.]